MTFPKALAKDSVVDKEVSLGSLAGDPNVAVGGSGRMDIVWQSLANSTLFGVRMAFE